VNYPRVSSISDAALPSNIAAYLPAMAKQQPYVPAIYVPLKKRRKGRAQYQHVTYQQLNEECDAIAHGLEGLGIRKGTRCVLMVKPSIELFSLTFALFKVGAVPVLIDPGIGLSNLKTCIARAEPEAFLGIPAAHLARIALRWGTSTIKTLVTVGTRAGWGGTTLKALRSHGKPLGPYTIAATQADDLAAVLFTSGSTGIPKGAIYRHGNFMTQVEAIREIMGIQPGEIDLPTFPLFALFDPALGMTTVIPDMDPTRPAKVDPRKLIEAIEDFGITNMFGSPALLNTVGRYGEKHDIHLPTLKRVISAGAPVSPDNIQRFLKMLEPSARLYTPYGATEALPVACISSDEILKETYLRTEQGKGVCIGVPVPSIQAKIIRISDEPIATWDEALVVEHGQIGEITVKGPAVTHAYLNEERSTKLAKIQSTDGFYHRMGDLGYFDDQGRLWFCGRKAHRIQTADQTMFTIPCEAVFNTHPHVYRSALVGVEQHGVTVPAICVELDPSTPSVSVATLRSQLSEIALKYPHTRSIQHFLVHPGFPVDIRHNAKIGRDKLAVWAKEQLS
jgi:olefin beta-lactone synthetase